MRTSEGWVARFCPAGWAPGPCSVIHTYILIFCVRFADQFQNLRCLAQVGAQNSALLVFTERI